MRAASVGVPRAIKSSLKSPRSGTMTAASMPACAQRRARRSAARSPSLSLSRAITRRETPEGGAKAPRLPAESAAAAVMDRDRGYQGQHGLDAFAGKERSDAVGGKIAEAHGAAVNSAKRFARVSDARLGGRARIQPSALDAGKDAVIAGDGGDQRGQTAHAGGVAVEQFGMKPQRRK